MINKLVCLIVILAASSAFSAENNLSCKIDLLKNLSGGSSEVASSLCSTKLGSFGVCISDLFTEKNGNVLRMKLTLHSRKDIPEVDLDVKRIDPYSDDYGTQLISLEKITGYDIKKFIINSEYLLVLNCNFTNSLTNEFEN